MKRVLLQDILLGISVALGFIGMWAFVMLLLIGLATGVWPWTM